jgi:hypothetical protein
MFDPRRRRAERVSAPSSICLPRVTLSAVFRRLFFLLAAVVLLQETNLGSLFFGAECIETCPNDTASGHCSPICATCSCGTHANPVTPQATRLPAPASLEGHQIAETARSASDIHLPDILHIPKRPLA